MTESPIFAFVERAFHDTGSKAYTVLNTAVGILILLSVGIFCLDVFGSVTHPWLTVADNLLLWVFVLEIALRVVTYVPPQLKFFELSASRRLRMHLVGRLKFLFWPMNMFDIIAVVSLYPALRGLRGLRLLRLVRHIKLFRYSDPFSGLKRAFVDNALLYVAAFGFLGSAILLSGLSFYLVEGEHNEDVANLADGIWWAVVTITTVGFGDITPVTDLGRLVGGVVMVIGMFSLAVFAGIVGHTLLNTILTLREEQFIMAGHIDHIVICGYDSGSRVLLRKIREEYGEDTDIVVFSPSERTSETPASVDWVRGDPTREDELPKTGLSRARAVVVVGSRTCAPEVADATTILTLFTIRSFMESVDLKNKRKLPLHLSAEILDPENIDHARIAGANEVVETSELGFSILARAASVPGSASLIGVIAAPGSQSVFVSAVPPFVTTPIIFGELVNLVKRQTGALVIGVRDSGGTDHLNPDNGLTVLRDHVLVYLAEAEIVLNTGDV